MYGQLAAGSPDDQQLCYRQCQMGLLYNYWIINTPNVLDSNTLWLPQCMNIRFLRYITTAIPIAKAWKEKISWFINYRYKCKYIIYIYIGIRYRLWLDYVCISCFIMVIIFISVYTSRLRGVKLSSAYTSWLFSYDSKHRLYRIYHNCYMMQPSQTKFIVW